MQRSHHKLRPYAPVKSVGRVRSLQLGRWSSLDPQPIAGLCPDPVSLHEEWYSRSVEILASDVKTPVARVCVVSDRRLNRTTIRSPSSSVGCRLCILAHRYLPQRFSLWTSISHQVHSKARKRLKAIMSNWYEPSGVITLNGADVAWAILRALLRVNGFD